MSDNHKKCSGGFCDRAAHEAARRDAFRAGAVAGAGAQDAAHIAGIPLKGDPQMPPGEVAFRESNGHEAGRIGDFQRGTPGKMFTRETICAILKSRLAAVGNIPSLYEARRELSTLLYIFERME